MTQPVSDAAVLILDGGMGRELKAMGAPFRQPEWSALALMEAPAMVSAAHANFVRAGADVITTNSYALVPYHIGEECFTKGEPIKQQRLCRPPWRLIRRCLALKITSDGAALAALAGELARGAADAAAPSRRVLVAASLPPTCGSYAPGAFSPERAARVLGTLVPALSPHADLWLAETLGCVDEARAADAALRAAGVRGDGRPLWLSFTLRAGGDAGGDGSLPCLLSGESVAEAAEAALELGAAALLLNCAPPELMRAALAAARTALDHRSDSKSAASHADAPAVRLGVYANAFAEEPSADAPANAALRALRPELTPEAYAAFAADWIAAGATIVGGCCGVGPAHIAALAAAMK
jgi:S-methylmethionine-dependent homocysteine/selenocysteine methylase